MSKKTCPFCKEEISTDDAVCPHCTRVLRERVARQPERAVPPPTDHKNSTRNSTSSTKRTWRLSEMLSSLRARLSFPKNAGIYFQSTKAEKVKKLALIVAIFLFTSGLYLRNRNIAISPAALLPGDGALKRMGRGFFTVDKSRYYLQILKSIGDELGENVKSVAKFTGTTTDKNGRKVNTYAYSNSDLNISLFNQKWGAINSEYSNLKQDIVDGKIRDQNKLNEILNYYRSIYFFAANELWFRAYETNDLRQVSGIAKEIEAAIGDDQFNKYLKGSREYSGVEVLLRKMNAGSQTLACGQEIEELKNQISSCEQYNNCGDYSHLISRHNELIRKYNAGNKSLKELFASFMDLVDVYLLFPGQDTIGQTTSAAQPR